MSQTKPTNLTNNTVKHDTLFTTPLDKAARFFLMSKWWRVFLI